MDSRLPDGGLGGEPLDRGLPLDLSILRSPFSIGPYHFRTHNPTTSILIPQLVILSCLVKLEIYNRSSESAIEHDAIDDRFEVPG